MDEEGIRGPLREERLITKKVSARLDLPAAGLGF
jgi:hypothetical protein